MESSLIIYDKNSNIKAYNPQYTSVDTITEPQLASTYVIVASQEMRSFMAFLKLSSLLRVTNAIDITVTDVITKELRFNVTYQLQSISSNTRWNIST